MKATFGADPEILFADLATHTHRSVQGLMPGTKSQPHIVSRGCIQADNVAGEFNIEPTITGKAFADNIQHVMFGLTTLLGGAGLYATEDSIAAYSDTDLQHPATRESGCDPDWNAYTLRMNMPPDYTTTNLRSAGGHIHVGYELGVGDIPAFIKALDLFVSVPMMVHDDPARRQLYGKAGAFRVKPYGVEYRTPSNFWVFKRERCEWVIEQVRHALAVFHKIELPEDLNTIIDQHQVSRLDSLMSAYSIPHIPK